MASCARCRREVAEGARFCPFCGSALPRGSPAGSADPLIGTKFAGRYFVHQLLGRGRTGAAYKATHLTLDRPVVLRLPPAALVADAAGAERFLRELRAASALAHPGVPAIVDFGRAEDGAPYVATEFQAGRPLARVLAEDGPFAEARAIHVAAQVLEVLAAAHGLGIAHGGLEPDAVTLESSPDEADLVRVQDFGVARLAASAREPDPPGDLRAVGALVGAMLTGRADFDPEAGAIRESGLDLTPALEALLVRCLATDPGQRPASAAELRAELLAVGAQLGPERSAPAPMRLGTAVLPAVDLAALAPGRKPAATAPVADIREAVRSAGAPRREPEAHPPSDPGATTIIPAHVVAPAPRRPEAPSKAPAGPGATTVLPAQRPPAPAPPAPPPSASAPSSRATPPPPRAPTPPPRRPTPPRGEPQPPPPAAESPEPGAAAPSRRTSAGGKAPPPRRTPERPLPRRPAEEESEPGAEESPPAVQPWLRRTPVLAGLAAGLLLLVGLVVFAVTRSPSPAAPPGAAEAQAPAAPPAAAAPAAEAALRAPPEVPLPPPPDTTRREAPRREGKGVKIWLNRPGLRSIPVPPAASGHGVLALAGKPSTQVWIEGVEVGATPREVRLAAGTYRLRATHPTDGTLEKTVHLGAGKRVLFRAEPEK